VSGCDDCSSRSLARFISTVRVLARGFAHELSSGKADSGTLLKLLEKVPRKRCAPGRSSTTHKASFRRESRNRSTRTWARLRARWLLLGHEIDRERFSLHLEVEPRPIPIFTNRKNG
jgi:hypothetical protein